MFGRKKSPVFKEKLEQYNFRGLGKLYIMAITAIVLVLIGSQVFIQQYIYKQQQDATVINIAGRQRMLSQKISKEILQLGSSEFVGSRLTLIKKLTETRKLWMESHERLVKGNFLKEVGEENSLVIKRMYEKMTPEYQSIVKSTDSLLNILSENPYTPAAELMPYVHAVIEREGQFLSKMDIIVFQYNSETEDKVTLLRDIELVLLIVSLLVVAFELLFIFRPTAQRVVGTVNELLESEKESKKMYNEIQSLYHTLGQAYQVLADKEQEEPLEFLFAKTDLSGKVVEVTEQFSVVTEFDPDELPSNLKDWLVENGQKKDFVEHIWKLVQKKGKWNSEVQLMSKSGDFIWLDMNLVLTTSKRKAQVLLICTDITSQKEAEEVSKELNNEKIRQSVKSHQLKANLILKGQEEERKRISKDIHDGIGQLLTGLKFTLESINFKHPDKLNSQLKDARSLVKRLISESRRVSFNLAPSALLDYGLASVINKFASEASRLSDFEVIFKNKTGFLSRLDETVEVNIYRIIQEGVNNAIKYSAGTTIQITMVHNSYQLTITIKDDGKGFDFKALGDDEKGLGLLNMKERANLLNGALDIEGEVGVGTSIVLVVPLKKTIGFDR